MMSCREASRWVSDALDAFDAKDAPLTMTQKLQMRFHILLCHSCRKMDAQLKQLRTACKKAAVNPSLLIAGKLSDNALVRILSAVQGRRRTDRTYPDEEHNKQ